MLRVTPPRFVILSLLAAAGCVEDIPDAEDTEPVATAVDALADPLDPDTIIDGLIHDSDRDVRIRYGLLRICTGTLLRNDVVLTARHCLTQDTSIEGTLVPPHTLTVTQDGPGATLGESRTVAEIIAMDIDVAMLRLSAPLTIDGRTYGQSTQLLMTDQSEVVGDVVLCQGYGNNTCSSGAGTLRAGLVEIVRESVTGKLVYEPWLGFDWIQAQGDSGSSCRWGPVDGNLSKALGVATGGGCGSVTEVAPEQFRDWVVDRLNVWAGGTFFDPFSSPWPWLADVDVPAVMYGGTPQWQVSGGALREPSDAYTLGPNFEGTRYVNAHQVASDAIVSATITSTDDDGAGIIGRYRDSTHYYRFSLDEERHFARIVRRDGDDWTVIAEDVDYDIDWSDAPRVGLMMIGPLIAGLVDGQIVTLGFDDIHGYTAGRSGLYDWRLAGATFDDFEIERL